MDNHADRPEFRNALQGETGMALRFSNTLEEQMMYLAVPIIREDKLSGVARISIPITLPVDSTCNPASTVMEPLPQPISKILEFLSSFTCFNKKLLKDLMYFCEDNQVLLSQFFKDDIKS